MLGTPTRFINLTISKQMRLRMPTPHSGSPTPHALFGKTAAKGFSLIISLVLMSLLLLLSLGAGALLALELRVSRASSAVSQARLNAEAAGRVALGEIQRLLGSDRRVSANAAILSPDGDFSSLARPRLTGVWRGGVVASDYDDAHRKAFVGWLSSGADAYFVGGQPETALNWAKSTAPDPDKDWALLNVMRPHAGAPGMNDAAETARTLTLRARPESLAGRDEDTSAGAIAWCAMDENQKARVNLHERLDDGFADKDRRVSGAGAAARFHIDALRENFPAAWSPTLPKGGDQVHGWRSLSLDRNADDALWAPVSDGGPVPALRHDFTTDSVSLLTDGVNGGLKRDMNLLPLLSDTDFSALKGIGRSNTGSQGWIGEDADRQTWRDATSNPNPGPVGGFRPWQKDALSADLLPTYADIRQWAAFPTTGGLMTMQGGVPRVAIPSFAEVKDCALRAIAKQDDRSAAHWRMPVLNRIRVEYSYVTIPNATPGKVTVVPRINFVAQLWNPYSVRLKLSDSPTDHYWFRTLGMPIMLKFYVNGVQRSTTVLNISSIEYGMPLYPTGTADYLEPGEIRTFTVPTFTSTSTGNGGPMKNGYSPSGGIVMNDTGHTIIVDETDELAYAVARTNIPGYLSYFGNFETYREFDRVNNSSGFIGSFGKSATTVAQNNWVRIMTPEGKITTMGPAGALTPEKRAVLDIRLKSEKYAISGGLLTEIPGMLQITLQPLTSPDPTPAFMRTAYEWVGWDTALRNIPEDPNDLQVTATSASPTSGGFGGTGFTPSSGLTNPIYHTLPVTPPLGLLDLRGLRLTGGLRPLPDSTGVQSQVNKYNGGDTVHAAFGNSLAHYAVPQDRLYAAQASTDFISNGQVAMDHSWYLNTVLADTWFASSLGDWAKGATGAMFTVGKNYPDLLRDFFTGKRRLPDRRLSPVGPDPSAAWVSGDKATPQAFRSLASRLLVEGGFNVNSTSVRAWRAFLASSRDAGFMKLDGNGLVPGTSIAARVQARLMPSTEPAAPGSNDNEARANGGRELSDADLDKLAIAAVAEVRRRGPFLSLGEFLNRRIETGERGVKGAMQAAIDKAGLNAGLSATGRPLSGLGQGNPAAEAAYDRSGIGNPGWVSQADLLAPLSTALGVRGDTFVILAAGEGPDGTRIHTELVVRRTAEFLDTRDDSATETPALRSAANKAFGRRFVIVARRQTSPDDL